MRQRRDVPTIQVKLGRDTLAELRGVFPGYSVDEATRELLEGYMDPRRCSKCHGVLVAPRNGIPIDAGRSPSGE